MIPKKVVWILGSGFSKSLGGPLLDELMQKSRLHRLTQEPKYAALGSTWETIVERYAATVSNPDKPNFPWSNAEEFIEMIELANTGDAAAVRTIQDAFLGSPPSDLAKYTRKLLAAVTHDFVRDANTKSERWQPYTHWADQLMDDDHVITFNYDLVVEKAYPVNRPGRKIAVSTQPGQGQLSKVHGSVDWYLQFTGSSYAAAVARDPVQLIADLAHDQAIGVPGPGKMESCNGVFSEIWKAATDAIRAADVIVFVGYRFPQSDNYAKQTLLNAIRQNTRDYLSIRTVLGPRRSDDVERLEGLLGWALSEREMPCAVKSSRLWAEDFLAVFVRAKLLVD